MKKIGIFILITVLLVSSSLGVVTSKNQSSKVFNPIGPTRDYTHTVFVEVGTSQNCKPCDSWNKNIYDIYTSGEYDFEYVEMIEFDHDGKVLNDKANDWSHYYQISSYPTSIFDGDYQRIVGDQPEVLPDALDFCGGRAVADITASMSVSWLGSGTIQVDISIENNDNTQYNGHIRTCITEIVSRYDTYYGDPYHFGFLDYAFDKDISINAGDIYTDSVVWDGNEHEDNHGNDFGDIDPDNIQIIMSVLNNNNGFVDETTIALISSNHPPYAPTNPSPSNGAGKVDIEADLSWSCSDPDGDTLNYDVYFGTINPPPRVTYKQSEKNYNPGNMAHNTPYYWQIVARDSHDVTTAGPIWSFTTIKKESIPPEIRIIKPERAFYINNEKILSRLLLLPLIIGDITIEVDDINEDSVIKNVEFYVNGKLKENDDTEPFSFFWTRDRFRFIHTYIITVVAYNEDGAESVKNMLVKRYL
jgi:hypothetical protein